MSALLKLGLVIVWPVIAIFLMVCVAVVLVCAWVLITFGTIRKKDDGTYEMLFKQGEP